ncbi:hypothetical protein DLAC_08686 [Tieghemostelium lacteum]|uniref:Uncharacterized protein n=1 Tax=Tieghemostelium lacteum TaxID=361077 RepID=A0A151Z823_TIELA|nr:hypothetical protein DLAC_08686 [Tieghemostelium lacteum]|eukprot:KYQ90101.1 hypothetical protein DLAC_08686 [Tieghemostelium lacteum]
MNNKTQLPQPTIVEEEEEEIQNFDSFSKDDLIEAIQDIRGEYYLLEDRFEGLSKRLKDKTKEVEFNRKLLTEREDLLLQLQWEPSQDLAYIRGGNGDPKNEVKMKAIIDQLRILEKGIFERDEKIQHLEKVIEKFTLDQINQGQLPTQVNIPAFSTIPPNSSSKVLNYEIVNTNSPTNFKSLSEYTLSKSPLDEINQLEQASVQVSNNQTFTRSPSFWNSPSQYFNSWYKKEQYQENSSSNRPEKPMADNEGIKIN